MNLATPLPAGPPLEHRLRIVRVPQGSSYRVTVAATQAATTWTHFTDGRTRPCPDDGTCSACAAGLNRKFEAYLAVQRDVTGERVVLALPEGAWRQVQALLGNVTAGGLWGHHLEFVRRGGPRGRLEVFDCGPLKEDEKKPRPVNTPVILERAWSGGQMS